MEKPGLISLTAGYARFSAFFRWNCENQQKNKKIIKFI
jgi:hypothetical protein